MGIGIDILRSTMASRCCLLVFALQLILLVSLAHSLPFVLLHGINAACNKSELMQLTKSLSEWSGSQGYCVEIGNGVSDSWFRPMEKQAEDACKKVKQMPELSEGYNLVGLSQGNAVGRGLIEFCDGGPPIKNYISIAGVHAGIASAPLCETVYICQLMDCFMLKYGVYSDEVQQIFAPSGYIKIPTAYDAYIQGSRFLPKLNNEYDTKNPIYKQRFASLENLVLIKFEQDTVLVPKETSWFGSYPDGDDSTVLPVQETALYKEDWIGLKTLDEAGKVKFVNVTGQHLEISDEELKKYVVPYLVDHQAPTRAIMEPLQLIDWGS